MKRMHGVSGNAAASGILQRARFADQWVAPAFRPCKQQAMAMPCGHFETDLRSREGGRLHEWEYRDERIRHGDAVACNQ